MKLSQYMCKKNKDTITGIGGLNMTLIPIPIPHSNPMPTIHYLSFLKTYKSVSCLHIHKYSELETEITNS